MPTNSRPRWRAPASVQQQARKLRNEMTPAEQHLWLSLRGNSLNNAYFRRQHAIGVYILDFYCAKAKLAVEVDGDVHLDRGEADSQRTEWLEVEHGIRVIRFTNEAVFNNLETVLHTIQMALTRSKGCST